MDNDKKIRGYESPRLIFRELVNQKKVLSNYKAREDRKKIQVIIYVIKIEKNYFYRSIINHRSGETIQNFSQINFNKDKRIFFFEIEHSMSEFLSDSNIILNISTWYKDQLLLTCTVIKDPFKPVRDYFC